jgi:hypothetical protein
VTPPKQKRRWDVQAAIGFMAGVTAGAFLIAWMLTQ